MREIKIKKKINDSPFESNLGRFWREKYSPLLLYQDVEDVKFRVSKLQEKYLSKQFTIIVEREIKNRVAETSPDLIVSVVN